MKKYVCGRTEIMRNTHRVHVTADNIDTQLPLLSCEHTEQQWQRS